MIGRCPSLINERGNLGTDKSVPYKEHDKCDKYDNYDKHEKRRFLRILSGAFFIRIIRENPPNP
ncbi:MAG: hypothetical protein FWG87_14670 [Defluviitaleaceae bacterium]|nr:hypothetical protein [Defluviitaleaceae bacterium]